MHFVGVFFCRQEGNIATIGQLHDNVILLQLPESLSVLFSYAN